MKGLFVLWIYVYNRLGYYTKLYFHKPKLRNNFIVFTNYVLEFPSKPPLSEDLLFQYSKFIICWVYVHLHFPPKDSLYIPCRLLNYVSSSAYDMKYFSFFQCWARAIFFSSRTRRVPPFSVRASGAVALKVAQVPSTGVLFHCFSLKNPIWLVWDVGCYIRLPDLSSVQKPGSIRQSTIYDSSEKENDNICWAHILSLRNLELTRRPGVFDETSGLHYPLFIHVWPENRINKLEVKQNCSFLESLGLAPQRFLNIRYRDAIDFVKTLVAHWGILLFLLYWKSGRVK